MLELLRRVVFDSPVSTAGSWYATAVGAAWGFIWSTGRVERHGRLFVFRGMPRWAYRRGGSCVGRCYLTGQNVSEPVLRHESVHERQWRRYGMLFPLLYLASGRKAHTNRFEVEAGLEDGGYLPRSR